MTLSKKELLLAENLGLYDIDIDGVIKRTFNTNTTEIIKEKIDSFCFDSICLIASTFTHYVPNVYAKTKFYRLAIIVNGEIDVEYFGKNSDSMNENYLKLKDYCRG